MLLLTLLMSSSSNYTHLVRSSNIWLSLQKFPSYFYLYLHPPLSAAPDSTLYSLMAHGVEAARSELTLRAINKGNISKAQSYWQHKAVKFSPKSKDKIASKLYQNGQWQGLSDFTKHHVVPQKFTTLVALQKGVEASEFKAQHLNTLGIALLPKSLAFDAECKNQVLMLSDHYQGVKKLKELKHAFDNKPEPQQNSFCLSQVYYIGDLLDCDKNTLGFASCDHEKLKALVSKYNVDNGIIMTRSGRANVRDNIMSLSLHSDYELFIHELMHFSGFEDEYPIYVGKANWLCKTKGMKAPNLYVGTKADAPHNFQHTNTCLNGKYKAFKPSKKWSKMQYYSMPLSPEYRRLWVQKVRTDWLKKQQLSQKKTNTRLE